MGAFVSKRLHWKGEGILDMTIENEDSLTLLLDTLKVRLHFQNKLISSQYTSFR
jgi:hypothetical protein